MTARVEPLIYQRVLESLIIHELEIILTFEGW